MASFSKADIFWAPKRFQLPKKLNVYRSVVFATFELIGKIVQNYDFGKIVSPPFF